MVSTPLHLLVSLAIIGEEGLDNPHLIFIDQVEGRDNPYLSLLAKWPENPFKTQHVFYRPEKKLSSKRKTRKATFDDLAGLMRAIAPEHIYVGNDRRIEFQWCMHCMQVQGSAAKGYYLDEGTFTYVGRKASDSFSDRVIDNALKKISYGLWWKHPPTVGGSEWIHTVYASFPDLVHEKLKHKTLKTLSLAYWQTPLLLNFCSALLAELAAQLSFSDLDVVVTLPHESIIAQNPAYKSALVQLLESESEKGLSIGVKYHPRDAAKDALGVAKLSGVRLLPAAIPFEAMLTVLKADTKVLGDFSSTLISARLLRPDLPVQAVVANSNNVSTAFLNLYQQLNIQVTQVA